MRASAAGGRGGHLVLTTNYYPYGYTNEFLSWEIEALANTFERITVVPLDPRLPQSVAVPGNVTVDTSLASAISPALRRSVPSGAPTGRRTRGVRLRRRPAENGPPMPGSQAPVLGPASGGALDLRRGRGLRRVRQLVRPATWPILRSQLHSVAPSLDWLAGVALATTDYATVRRWARSQPPPDVAYTFWMGPTTAALRSAWPDTAIVSRAHRGDIYSEPLGWPLLPLQERCAAAADLIAVISQDGKDYLQSKFPGLTDIEVHYLGTGDPGTLSPRSTDGVLRVWSISNLVDVKRVPLIAAAVRLVAADQLVQWTHVGAGPEHDLVLAEVSGNHPNLQVEMLGAVPHGEVLERLRQGPVDAFCNASTSEGVPVSLMEALALGIPAVATDVGGVSEIVRAPQDILLPATASARDFAEAIRRVVTLPTDFADVRRELWRRRFDGDANAAAFAARLVDLRAEVRAGARHS